MKVIIKTQIHGDFAAASTADVYVYREFDWPFAPFAGLEVGASGDFYAQIKSIVWDDEQQRFECYAEENEELYEAGLHNKPRRPIDEIVQEYVEAGWAVEAGTYHGDRLLARGHEHAPL